MSAQEGDLLPDFFVGNLEKLDVLVAPHDLVERYQQIFGDDWDGQPVATELIGPATMLPIETDDPDTLSIEVTTRVGEKDYSYRYSMYLNLEALHRAVERDGFDFWDAVDFYGPARDRMYWALFGTVDMRDSVDASETPDDTRARKFGRILGWLRRT